MWPEDLILETVLTSQRQHDVSSNMVCATDGLEELMAASAPSKNKADPILLSVCI
jgi:hypothetical protein